MDLRNQSFQRRKIDFHVQPSTLQHEIFTLITSNLPPSIGAGESARIDVFVRFKKSGLTFGKTRIGIMMESELFETHSGALSDSGHSIKTNEVTLVGPL